MDYQVYVISKNNEPLMPTKRFGNVRRMLKEKRAKVVQTKPFTRRAKSPLLQVWDG